MKIIKLTHGLHTEVSDEDFESLSKYKWHTKVCKYTAYACRSERGSCNSYRKQILMHRFLLGTREGEMVDHIDGNGLNNTRENIRIVTAGQNNMNRRLKSHGKSSKYKGVSRYKGRKKWVAHITKDGKTTYLGSFKNEGDAGLAYNKAALELFGEFAALNDVEPEKSFSWQDYFKPYNI